MKKYYLLLSFSLLAFLINSCDIIPDPTQDSSPSETSIEGTWVRLIGASGDRTDLAIGGIEGEPENRVYMCEKRGSTAAGFYKGYLNGDMITWDEQYNLPDTYLQIVGPELEFDYRCCGAVPTYYERGDWSGECGPLENTSIILAVGLDNRDFYETTIRSVTIDGISVPLAVLNETTTEPDCEGYEAITLPAPAQTGDSGSGYYMVEITYSYQGADTQWHTEVSRKAWYKHYFDVGCNKYKIGWNNGYTLIPL